jgi:heme exporter protein D
VIIVLLVLFVVLAIVSSLLFILVFVVDFAFIALLANRAVLESVKAAKGREAR